MDFFRLLLAGVREQRMLFGLMAGFALFPAYTAYADLPFWNDVAMRIMLLGMAAMGLNLILGYGGMPPGNSKFWHLNNFLLQTL